MSQVHKSVVRTKNWKGQTVNSGRVLFRWIVPGVILFIFGFLRGENAFADFFNQRLTLFDSISADGIRIRCADIVKLRRSGRLRKRMLNSVSCDFHQACTITDISDPFIPCPDGIVLYGCLIHNLALFSNQILTQIKPKFIFHGWVKLELPELIRILRCAVRTFLTHLVQFLFHCLHLTKIQCDICLLSESVVIIPCLFNADRSVSIFLSFCFSDKPSGSVVRTVQRP